MSADRVSLITSKDGSHTLYNEAINETYHSRHGAWNESAHVFITSGFIEKLKEHASELGRPLRILEVGMGTGLNLLQTLSYVLKHETNLVLYEAIEPFPVPASILRELNYQERLPATDQFLWETLHGAPCENWFQVIPNFQLLKTKIPLQEWKPTPIDAQEPSPLIDVVYYDAFAPQKQPDMWTQEIFSHLAQYVNPGGILVTYCAQGQFRRDLAAAGFAVSRMPGPPGKREMVRARRLE